MTTKRIVIIIAVVLIVAIGIYFLFFRKKKATVGAAKTSVASSSGKSSNAIGTALQGIKALQSAPGSIGALFNFESSMSSSKSDDTQEDADDA